MIRYLDNNDNRKSSPNQNFGRELLELFLLGVGNYTEADVEASTAAWTGHTDNWETDAYVWRADWHDNSNKSFLGATINLDKTADGQKAHGYEVIDVDARRRQGAGDRRQRRQSRPRHPSASRPSSSRGSCGRSSPARRSPAAVLTAMRDAAIANDFAIKPWLRTMLLRPEFYDAGVQAGPRAFADRPRRRPAGRERQALRGGDAAVADGGMGQRPLFPPNVSGWKHNGYFVNASAMAKRTETAQMFFWRLMDTYWDDAGPNAGVITLAGRNDHAGPDRRHRQRHGQGAQARRRPAGDDAADRHRRVARRARTPSPRASSRWERADVLLLIMLMPELHVA